LDEASTSYDAWALLHYGMDRNGFRFPVELVAWGGGSMSALPAYLTMPGLWLLGPTETAARLPSLVVNLLAIGCFYFLCRRLCGESMARIAILLLVISPWHVLASRWGHEFNLLPAWVLFGATAFSMIEEKRQWPFLLGCAFISSSIYVYAPALFFAPLFLVGCTLILLRRGQLRKGTLAAGALIAGAIAVPMALFLAINQLHMHSLRLPILSIPRLPGTPRYAVLSVFHGGHLVHNLYSNSRSLLSLLVSQRDGLLWNAVPGFGVVYPWGVVAAFAGLLVLPRLRRRHGWEGPVDLMVAWLGLALLLGLVTTPNLNRINLIYLPLVFFAALAIHAIRWRQLRMVAVGLCLLAFLAFLRTYFSTYARAIAPRFYASLGDAITDASMRTDGTICVTTQAYRPYIYALYYQRIDPALFLETVRYSNPAEEFRQVQSFGRFFFGIDDCRKLPQVKAYVVERERESDFTGYSVYRHELYSVVMKTP
jgi:4-amino-4-deoxy-L-arabinose transferase-like glycosyltransferase